MSKAKQSGLALLSLWVKTVQRHSLVVLLAAVLLAGLCLHYTVNNLGMNTNTLEMLSSDLPWRQLDNHYKQEFPQYRDDMVIVIESATPDQASDAAKFLYQQLTKDKKNIVDIFHSGSLNIFTESALLYLEEQELQQLADDLSQIQPFLAALTDDPGLTGLFSMLGQIIDAIEAGEAVDITPVIREINKTIKTSIDAPDARLSWQRLIGPNEQKKSVYREFILLKPKLDYSNLMPADMILNSIQKTSEETNLEKKFGVKVRLTGSVALQHEDLVAVTEGTKFAMTIALIMVTFIMLFGLRSAKLMLFTIFNLVIGLSVTAAFAALTVGKLNLISVAFTVLYIGLGVDFAIHFCLRYREHLLNQTHNTVALNETAINIGSSLFICAISTAVGFFAFIPTDYKGVAELGWIAGFGMFFSFIFTLTILPALFKLSPLQLKTAKRTTTQANLFSRLSDVPIKYCRSIIITTGILFIFALIAAANLTFDSNTLNLQDAEGESLQTFRELLSDKSTSPWTAITLAKDEHDAQANIAAFSTLKSVEKSVYINNFIPAGQDEKLAIIDEMSLLLGELSITEQAAAANNDKKRQAINNLLNKLQLSSQSMQIAELVSLKKNLQELTHANDRRLEQLETALMATLPGRIDALNKSLNADYISLETLPEVLRKRWRSDNGYYRIEIFPSKDLQDQAAMREFVDDIRSVNERVTGSPIINLSASDSVVKSFKQAFLYAFIVISLLLLILCHDKRDVFYVLTPLIMAAVFTAALTTLSGMQLNFANVIALPLLLGIGVDSGVHIMHRFRTDSPEDGNILHSSSARGVIVSSLTTMAGMGNLAISHHTGTASMGVLLTLGIIITVFCMLLILPALLACTHAANKNNTHINTTPLDT